MVESFAKPKMSLFDYLSWESQQTDKHDFLSGEVFAMTGGTLRHNRATLRTMMAFENHLAGSPCKVFSGDVKVAANVTEHWFYPDVLVTCSASDLSDMSAVAVIEPTLILEVLSPSTAAYDRGKKNHQPAKTERAERIRAARHRSAPARGVPAQRGKTL